MSVDAGEDTDCIVTKELASEFILAKEDGKEGAAKDVSLREEDDGSVDVKKDSSC